MFFSLVQGRGTGAYSIDLFKQHGRVISYLSDPTTLWTPRLGGILSLFADNIFQQLNRGNAVAQLFIISSYGRTRSG